MDERQSFIVTAVNSDARTVGLACLRAYACSFYPVYFHVCAISEIIRIIIYL